MKYKSQNIIRIYPTFPHTQKVLATLVNEVTEFFLELEVPHGK